MAGRRRRGGERLGAVIAEIDGAREEHERSVVCLLGVGGEVVVVVSR